MEAFKLLDAIEDLEEKLERLAILLLGKGFIDSSRRQLIKVFLLITIILIVGAEKDI